ncbi:hypothetical protein JTE90_013486 [Oedothorax gibbosus]|uniref:Uncharacterized protein n=1 Tax=Oedothorax gibbosus TaxID=931172 RepID=A0AAV6VL92_9ARAC|nr:hypothetical protein JTE90_013486 [Oedothorax gibbosus]
MAKKEDTKSKAFHQEEDPWTRLYYTPTDCFLKRFAHESRKSPADSLELSLKSTCNQSSDWPISKADAVRQPLGKARKYKCFCRPNTAAVERPFDHPLVIAPFWETPVTTDYIKLAIECPHMSQTNNGYSRKSENGNFYRF